MTGDHTNCKQHTVFVFKEVRGTHLDEEEALWIGCGVL